MVIRAVIMAMLFSMISVAANAAGQQEVPKLVVDSTTHDFGPVEAGKPVVFSFKMRNEGAADLLITGVQPNCGCTTPEYDKVVHPGKEGRITLQLNISPTEAGELIKQATVTTNDPKMRMFLLALRANVKPGPKVVSNASVTTGTVSGPFGISSDTRWKTSTLSGSKASGQIDLINSQPAPIRIKNVIPGGDYFTIKLVTVEEGRQYRMNIETSRPLGVGRYEQIMHLATDSTEHPDLAIPLEVTIFPKVMVAPAILNLGSIALTATESPAAATITVRKAQSRPIKVTAARSSLAFLNLEVKADASAPVASDGKTASSEKQYSLYRIRVVVDRSKAKGPGDFNGTIEVDTDDAETPTLSIPVLGSFSE